MTGIADVNAMPRATTAAPHRNWLNLMSRYPPDEVGVVDKSPATDASSSKLLVL